MPIRDHLLDLERRLKRLAGETAPREPLEIRQAVLQFVVDATQPTGRGQRVLPYDRVEVDVLAETPEARRVIEAVLEREDGLGAAVARALDGAGCTPPSGFAVEVRYRKRPPAGWSAGQRVAIAGRAVTPTAPTQRPAVAQADAPAPPPPAGALPVVRLKVVKGRAVKKVVDTRAERINIGRGEAVNDRDQRLVRRNDLAFSPGDEASDSVSRAHAHIRCLPSGECRLRDDNSAHGTRIVRGGRTIEVAATNTRGVRLQPGDDLHVGRAVVRFEIVDEA